MKKFDAQYDCMRNYLLYLGFVEISPYVFEETDELCYAVMNAPDYAHGGMGTWGKDLRICDIKVRLTKREKERLIYYCKTNGITQSEAVRQALQAYCFKD